MGNAVLQRREAGADEGKNKSKNAAEVEASAAARRRAAATPRVQREGEEVTTTRAGRWRRAGGGNDDDGSTVGTVVTVKILMSRKDAEALVARLHARERKARMTELRRQLRAGNGGGASPVPSCGDAWRPRLAPVKENQCS